MVYKTSLQSHFSFQEQLACASYLGLLEVADVSVWIPNPSRLSKKILIYGKRHAPRSSVWICTLHCYDPLCIDLISNAVHTTPALTWWPLLLRGALLAGAPDWTQLERPTLIFCLDIDDDYLRYTKFNMAGYRFSWRVAARDDQIAFTSVYLSVLGGAYSSLGKSNQKYAFKAGTLAWRQIKLAQWLQDPILECKCWLYYAEDMVMQGRFKRARRILERQRGWANRLQNTMLMTMCDFVQLKWNTATSSILISAS